MWPYRRFLFLLLVSKKYIFHHISTSAMAIISCLQTEIKVRADEDGSHLCVSGINTLSRQKLLVLIRFHPSNGARLLNILHNSAALWAPALIIHTNSLLFWLLHVFAFRFRVKCCVLERLQELCFVLPVKYFSICVVFPHRRFSECPAGHPSAVWSCVCPCTGRREPWWHWGRWSAPNPKRGLVHAPPPGTSRYLNRKTAENQRWRPT